MSIIVDQHNFLQKKRELGRIPYKQKTSQKVRDNQQPSKRNFEGSTTIETTQECGRE